MNGAAQRVDFYVLPGSDARVRLKLACRIAEKAFLGEQRVFVWLEDQAEMASFDELLWSFGERSFVPHELFREPQQWLETPVLLGCEAYPQQPFDMLINLGSAVSPASAQASRIAELVDADESHRAAGRTRFRHYRDRGITPETHNLTAEQLL